MMPPSDLPYKLEVSRAGLAQALKIIARVVAKSPGGAGFRFDNGCLSIEAGTTVSDAPARGTWPLPIFVGASWVRRLAKRMPVGDPIHLRVEAGRLYANRYSEPCAWTPRAEPPPIEQPKIDENLLVLEAARILKPLLVRKSHLEDLVLETRARATTSWSEEERTMVSIIANAWVLLAPLGVEASDIRRFVSEARARGTASWSKEEKKMISIVANAWVLLAPLGADTADIRRLVDDAVRSAWK